MRLKKPTKLYSVVVNSFFACSDQSYSGQLLYYTAWKGTIAGLCLFIPGMDATTVFQDIGHSFEALKILSKYQIGELREVSVQFEVKIFGQTPNGMLINQRLTAVRGVLVRNLAQSSCRILGPGIKFLRCIFPTSSLRNWKRTFTKIDSIVGVGVICYGVTSHSERGAILLINSHLNDRGNLCYLTDHFFKVLS